MLLNRSHAVLSKYGENVTVGPAIRSIRLLMPDARQEHAATGPDEGAGNGGLGPGTDLARSQGLRFGTHDPGGSGGDGT